MAKKADLLAEAVKLNLEVSEKNTIAEIEAAIAGAGKTTEETTEVVTEKETFAKAGKRSEKAVKEAAEEAERKAKVAAGDTGADEKKGPKPVTRPLIERRAKAYKKAAEKVEKEKFYTLDEAIKLATETATTKFDSTVEIHAKLGVDPRQADQNIRATVVLPNGTGKTIRVAAFAPEADAKGADIAGEEAVIKMLDKENLDFDVLITTPANMPKLGKYARVLGPKGLMPNPKAGTVTADIAKAIQEAKAGKVEYRVDKQAIIHLGVGKVSFGVEKLSENAKTFFESLNGNKPSSLKGSYIQTVSVATTMGPGIKVDLNTL